VARAQAPGGGKVTIGCQLAGHRPERPWHPARAVLIFALTLANVVIVSLAAYRGVEYMDSVAFCGEVCHRPMQPEFVAHQIGPHANVKCVDCHVGAGASSFVQAKLAGTRRVLAVASGRYPRPIVPAAHQLPAAAETCESATVDVLLVLARGSGLGARGSGLGARGSGLVDSGLELRC
jgi:hypothetical protein